jgi:hypothetical protein
VSDGTNVGRPDSSRRRLFAVGDNRFVIIAACVVAILCILVGGHLYGQFLSDRDLGGRDNTIARLNSENQKIKLQLDEKSAEATALQAKLDTAQASLNAILPSANTYNIDPNQSLVVAGGHLTVGLVGSPGNESVTLDINGKEQSISAGQVVNVAPDASTNCQVQVQSFDMFKAVLVASCTGAKPQ